MLGDTLLPARPPQTITENTFWARCWVEELGDRISCFHEPSSDDDCDIANYESAFVKKQI